VIVEHPLTFLQLLKAEELLFMMEFMPILAHFAFQAHELQAGHREGATLLVQGVVGFVALRLRNFIEAYEECVKKNKKSVQLTAAASSSSSSSTAQATYEANVRAGGVFTEQLAHIVRQPHDYGKAPAETQTQCERKNKQSPLSPGIFTVCCQHGVCLAIQV
jgi:hypothetical protein